MFEQIHEICFYGQGGYSWDVVYNWPIWLRRFTYNKIVEHYKKLKEDDNTITADSDPTKFKIPSKEEIKKPSIHYKTPNK